MYIKTKSLPKYVRKLMKTVSFNKREIELVVVESTLLNPRTSRGNFAYNIVVNLDNDNTNFLGDDFKSYTYNLNENEIVLRGRTGKNNWAVLYAHPNCSGDFIPQSTFITSAECTVLSIYFSSTGDDRESALCKFKCREENEEALVEKGLLNFTSGGASVTVKGKNALGI